MSCRSSSSITSFPTTHHYYHHHHRVSINFPPTKRSRFTAHASILHLPLLPFPLNQVFIPCEAKTLHLYEARYLALLDECLNKKRKQFVHFVLDPMAMSETSSEVSFAAKYGCLVMIEKIERLDVGALVSIRGIGRVKIAQFEQAEPFLSGAVVPLQDNVIDSTEEINSKVADLKEALHGLNTLEIKLKTPKDAMLQTQIVNSLNWAETIPDWDCDKAFIPSLPERVSFAALQPITGSSESELVNLQKEKLRAMDVKNTLKRLDISTEFARNKISLVAAKLAIQSLGV